jgi:SAM-dependent methyltransferase
MLAELDPSLLLCPVCKRGDIAVVQCGARCENPACCVAFPTVNGKPALVDFAASVIGRDHLLRSQAADLHRRPSGLRRRLMRILFGTDQGAARAAMRVAEELARRPGRPKLLVIGGGTVGSGAEFLYHNPGIEVTALDIYDSANVQLIADAHSLPFADAVFDAVWIQAVLEHVLDPACVVAEIYRVLAPHGLVYAGTPFMQQVHEGPYDFTRFTESGHRWLFRRFERVASGVTGGPGTAAIWSFRYLFAGLFRSSKAGWLAAACVFWLRYLDAFIPQAACVDAACGVWLIGRKSRVAISPRDAIAAYRGAQA